MSDIRNYIKRGKLWEAFAAEARPVLLIDEIDKADIEFPNDLLLELDRMEFHVYETGETVKARAAPDRDHHLEQREGAAGRFPAPLLLPLHPFPDPETMARIVEVHYPGIKRRLVEEALRIFFEVREVPGLKKKPSTSELLDWLKLLLSEDIGPEQLRERDTRKLIPPLHGALLKNEQDVSLFEKLAFITGAKGGNDAPSHAAPPRQGRLALTAPRFRPASRQAGAEAALVMGDYLKTSGSSPISSSSRRRGGRRRPGNGFSPSSARSRHAGTGGSTKRPSVAPRGSARGGVQGTHPSGDWPQSRLRGTRQTSHRRGRHGWDPAARPEYPTAVSR